MRTLLILIALALIVTVGKRLLQSPRPPQSNRQRPADMVQCGHCGMYIPGNEALQRGGQYYCCEAHRDADHAGSSRS